MYVEPLSPERRGIFFPFDASTVLGLFASIDEQQKLVIFTGNTYPYRDELKSLGARWDGQTKTWTVFGTVSRDQLLTLFPDIAVEVREKVEVLADNSTALPVIPTPRPGPETATIGATTKSPESSLSVAELIGRVRAILGSSFAGGFLVHGVIGKARFQGARVFVDLADQDERTTSIGCVIWDRADALLMPLVDAGYSLEPDLPVMFEVRIGLNNKGGQLSLGISRVIPEYTTGKLLAQRELTNRRLREEGLFDRNRQLTLPLLPTRLGILTSSGGTVINDFMASLSEGHFGFKLYWLPVSVQGKSAKSEIIAGIKKLATFGELEAILLFRGGGSPAELSLFNDYDIALAICGCPVPVISAIGHQEDQSSAQDVSFYALGVPKDVGSYFAKIALDVRARLQLAGEGTKRAAVQLCDLKHSNLLKTSHLLAARAGALVERKSDAIFRETRILPRQAGSALYAARTELTSIGTPIPALARARVSHQLSAIRQTAKHVSQQSKALRRESEQSLGRIVQLFVRAVETPVARSRQRLSLVGSRIADRLNALLRRAEAGIKNHELVLEAVRPEAQLRRGFTLIRREGAEGYIKREGEVKPDDQVVIEFQDGSKRAVIRS